MTHKCSTKLAISGTKLYFIDFTNNKLLKIFNSYSNGFHISSLVFHKIILKILRYVNEKIPLTLFYF